MSLDAARFVFEGQKHSMLWLSGFGYIAIGATWIITGILTTPDPAFDWISRYLGPTLSQPEWLALVWVVAGILQMLPILIPRNRRHQIVRPVAFGFGAAIFAPALWSAIYMLSGLHGYEYGLRDAVVFLVMAAIAWEISGWEDPGVNLRLSKLHDILRSEVDAD